MSYLVTSSDYTTSSYSGNEESNFTRIEYDIACAYPDKYQLIQPLDPRFDNTSWKNIRGCALYSLQLFLHAPTPPSLAKRAISLLPCIFYPLAYISDTCVDTTMLVAKLVAAADIAFTTTCVKILHLLSPKRSPSFPALKNRNIQDLNFSQNYLRFPLSLMRGFFMIPIDTLAYPLLLPFYLTNLIESPSCSYYYVHFLDGLEDDYQGRAHSYKIYNIDSGKNEYILDQRKVAWIKKTFGYHSLTDDQWKKLFVKSWIQKKKNPNDLQKKSTLDVLAFTHGTPKPLIQAVWSKIEKDRLTQQIIKTKPVYVNNYS